MFQFDFMRWVDEDFATAFLATHGILLTPLTWRWEYRLQHNAPGEEW